MPLLDRDTPQLANQNRAAKKVRAVGPPYIKALLTTEYHLFFNHQFEIANQYGLF